jgi:predicted esterase
MDKAKTHLSFIHRFIPPKNGRSEERAKQGATEGKAFTTFLLLHGTGGNEEDLIPLAYELDKRAAILIAFLSAFQ